MFMVMERGSSKVKILKVNFRRTRGALEHKTRIGLTPPFHVLSLINTTKVSLGTVRNFVAEMGVTHRKEKAFVGREEDGNPWGLFLSPLVLLHAISLPQAHQP